jgi:hypothetical protein
VISAKLQEYMLGLEGDALEMVSGVIWRGCQWSSVDRKAERLGIPTNHPRLGALCAVRNMYT